MKKIPLLVAMVFAFALCFGTLAASGSGIILGTVAVPAGDATPISKEKKTVAAELTALSKKGVFKHYNDRHADKIQRILTNFYRYDSEFMTDSAGDKRQLSDGVDGPITLKWLGKFCNDKSLQADSSDFEKKLMLALNKAAAGNADSPSRDDAASVPRVNYPVTEVTYRYDPTDPAIKMYPADLAERLKSMAQFPRKNKEEFRQAVKAKLEGVTYDEDLVDLIESKSLFIERKSLTYPYSQIFTESQLPYYQVLPDLSEEFLALATIPEPVATLIAGFHNVEYPTKELFESARAAYVRRALGMCNIEGRNPDGAMSDADFTKLSSVLPQDIFSDIGKLRHFSVERKCRVDEQLNAAYFAHKAYQILAFKLDKIAVMHTLNSMPVIHKKRITSWETEGCGCAPPDHGGVIYGFYPLWTKSEIKIDFSKLQRIGLYGQTFDEQGNLQYPPGMYEKDIPRDLIEAAHTHMTMIDWVVSRSDWSEWSRSSETRKNKIFANLESQILDKLRKPLRVSWWGSKANWLASINVDLVPTIGDGVTIDFKHFPSKDKEIFNDFILKLAADMKLQQSSLLLNIMADYEEIHQHQKDKNEEEMLKFKGENAGGNGAYSFTNIAWLLEKVNKVDINLPTVERRNEYLHDPNVLVMLHEPTGDTKKRLREGVQDALSGESSQRLLRNMVPILEYVGGHEKQLKEDVIYIADNYIGIGFWPLPFSDIGHANEKFTEVYSALKQWQHIVPPTYTEQFVISVVCPHRIGLRWAACGSFLLAIGSFWFFVKCTGCNNRLDNSVVFVAIMWVAFSIPFAVVLFLAIGDPLFAKLEIGLGIFCLIGLVVVATLLVRQILRRLRRKNP